jgi:PAS domain S-box-containing protein
MTERDKTGFYGAFNVLSEAVFSYNEKMEIQFFNQAAERITGYAREDVVGKKCVTLFRGNVCLNNCGLCATAKSGKGQARFQSPFVRKDGRKRMGEFNTGLLSRSGDGRLEVLVALNDITEIADLREELKKTYSFRNLVGNSPPMLDLFKTIRNIALFDSTVLLRGESGSGKELVAKAIHYESPRAARKLVKVNCSAFSESLLESELFGHVRGAFTGAARDRVSRIEEGDGGTLFLDEIGDMSLNIQVKLLRVIQEREIERVGENVVRKVDIRIIAATHKDLLQEARAGRFREDLYYRLNVIPLRLPSLRSRKGDIPLLARHFIKNWKGMDRKKVTGISDAALGRLMDYDWPGNVRELENAIEHACVRCGGETIAAADLPVYIVGTRAEPVRAGKPRKSLSRKIIVDALRRAGNNRSAAARLLGLHRITLWRKLREFGIRV